MNYFLWYLIFLPAEDSCHGCCWLTSWESLAKFSFNIFKWVNRHIMLKWSYAHKVQSYPVWAYAHIFISSKLLNLKKIWWFFVCILCLNLFGCWVRRSKVTKHFIYSIYCLAVVPARSQVVLPSRRGNVSLKTCHTADFSNPGYLQGIFSSKRATHQLS